jgi:hypothetical protein
VGVGCSLCNLFPFLYVIPNLLSRSAYANYDYFRHCCFGESSMYEFFLREGKLNLVAGRLWVIRGRILINPLSPAKVCRIRHKSGRHSDMTAQVGDGALHGDVSS